MPSGQGCFFIFVGDNEHAQQYLRRAAEIVRLHYTENSVAYSYQRHKLELAEASAARMA